MARRPRCGRPYTAGLSMPRVGDDPVARPAAELQRSPPRGISRKRNCRSAAHRWLESQANTGPQLAIASRGVERLVGRQAIARQMTRPFLARAQPLKRSKIVDRHRSVIDGGDALLL